MSYEAGEAEVTEFPWEMEDAGSKSDYEARDQVRHVTLRTERTEEVRVLFDAYEADKDNVVTEGALLQFVMSELNAGAQRAFDRAANSGGECGSDWQNGAEDLASEQLSTIWEKLKAGEFADHCHLLGYLGIKIRFFAADAFEKRKRSKKHEPLERVLRNVEGSEYAGEQLREVHRPVTVVVPPVLQAVERCFPGADRKLIQLLGVTEFNVRVVAEILGMTENAVRQRIKRMRDSTPELREMIVSFREPGESDEDLAERFLDFVAHLCLMRPQNLPECFVDALTVASHELKTEGTERTTWDKAVRHVVKLWREHQ